MTEPKQPFLVYLIDDDAFLLDMYALKFRECGVAVEVIQSPVIALEKLRSGATPDVIVVDVIMPSMDGFEFLEAVKKENLVPTARRVILSNQGQDEDLARGKSLGVDGYIIKARSLPSEVCEQIIAFQKK